MNKSMLLALGLLAAGTMGAHAADLATPPKAPPAMAPMAPALYVQLLAGPTLPLDTLFNTLSDKTKTGYAAAATVGVVVAKGVSLEADGLYTKRDFANAAGSVTTVSGMVNVKGTLDVSDSIALYAAAGVGYIWLDDGFANTTNNSGSGFGYQLIGGAAFKVAEKISILGEARYQNTFSAVTLPSKNTFQAPTVTVLAGVKLGF